MGFVKRYALNTSPETHPDLDRAIECAIRYYNDFVKPHKKYRLATDLEILAFQDLETRLKAWTGDLDPEGLQGEVYACGRDRFDPLRNWFTAIYEVLLGASQGPRFGGFIALYGVNETIKLINKAVNGELVE